MSPRSAGLTSSVREELARRIERGEWRPRDRLPSEPDLAASLGVSRATLREALRSLAEDGFVHRIQGSGTFVTHRPRLRNNLDVNFGVTDLIRSMGMEPGSRDVRVGESAGSEEDARALGLEPGDPVLSIERVRTADGRPVVFSVDLLPLRVLGDREGLGVGGSSIYELLEHEAGIVVQRGVASLRPANADRRLADLLAVPEGTLLLYIHQVDFDGEGRPVLLSHEHHVADAFEITVVRRGPGPRTKEAE
ncbi:MAG: GntR family transcriptional regulator [Actinomycetota bacterium]